MILRTILQLTALVPALILCNAATVASSNIDPVQKFSWSENAGWMNWHDANGGADGVFVDVDFLSGYIWMENVGWIDVGDGTPTDGEAYANDNDTDFGVNIDPGTGELFGFAWGENIGWINFDTASVAPDQARFDSGTGRFYGFAWSENIGWINLDDSTHDVSLAPIAPAPHDRKKNRYISFDPHNGPQVVAFRVQKAAVAAGSGFCTMTGLPCIGAPAQGTCAGGQLCAAAFPSGSPAHSCWVQTPVQTATADQYTAKCDSTPVFRVWTEPVVHVGDCEIIPNSDYTVFTNTVGPVEVLSGLAVQTSEVSSFNSKLWADSVGVNNGIEWTTPNRFTNVQDVLAILAFISGSAIKPEFTVVNLQATSASDSCLNPFVNVGDVLIASQAITGASYGPPSTGKIIDTATCPICP